MVTVDWLGVKGIFVRIEKVEGNHICRRSKVVDGPRFLVHERARRPSWAAHDHPIIGKQTESSEIMQLHHC